MIVKLTQDLSEALSTMANEMHVDDVERGPRQRPGEHLK